jgi:cell wall-associated NlpC family hydrolase
MPSLPTIFGAAVVDAAKAHAIEMSTMGEECCGAIVLRQSWANFEYVPLTNCAENPDDEFRIDPDQWLGLESDTLAVFHSHHIDTQPGVLTPADVASARECGKLALLYHTVFDCWDYWDPDYWYPWPLQDHNKSHPKTSDFVGWQFEYGRADCWSLARGWYDRMHSIYVPDYPRGDIEELEDGAFDPFMESYEDFGFVKVDGVKVDGPIQDSDLLIMRIGRYPTHCAIVVDAREGVGIHHLGQSLLSAEFQIEQWQSKTHAILRHKDLC